MITKHGCNSLYYCTQRLPAGLPLQPLCLHAGVTLVPGHPKLSLRCSIFSVTCRGGGMGDKAREAWNSLWCCMPMYLYVDVGVCVCVCVCHPKWRVEDHVVAEEAKESGCLVRSRLAASAGRAPRRLREPQVACRGFSPARSAAPRTVMDHRAPATRVVVFALLNHLPTAPPGPGLAAEWEASYGRQRPGTKRTPAQGSLT